MDGDGFLEAVIATFDGCVVDNFNRSPFKNVLEILSILVPEETNQIVDTS